MDQFFNYWFQGFQRSLDQMDDENRSQMLKECGKACSASYTRKVYLEAKSNSRNEEEFIGFLREAFPEIEITVIERNHIYSIQYNFCACDLVKQNYINTPKLCECSRQSLLYNWESILGEGNVKVELIQSLLSGAPNCMFQVTVLE